MSRLCLYCLHLQRCGGNLDKEPASNHAVELANPEWFDDNQDIDSDIFDIEYIFRCVKQLEVLDLEPFRYDFLVKLSHTIKHQVLLSLFFL